MHEDHVVDATDIALVDGGGPGCRIENNLIEAVARHAFAGIALHVFASEGNDDHTGSSVTGHTIRAGTNLMALGLSLGMHSWQSFVGTTANGGTVSGNTVSGAIVNLQVDGVAGLTVGANALSAPSGTPGCGGAPTNYTVAHATGATLVAGSIARVYDRCIP